MTKKKRPNPARYVAVDKGVLELAMNILSRGSVSAQEAVEEIKKECRDIEDFFQDEPTDAQLREGAIAHLRLTDLSETAIPNLDNYVAAKAIWDAMKGES